MKEFIQLTYSFCFLACLLDGGHIKHGQPFSLYFFIITEMTSEIVVIFISSFLRIFLAFLITFSSKRAGIIYIFLQGRNYMQAN